MILYLFSPLHLTYYIYRQSSIVADQLMPTKNKNSQVGTQEATYYGPATAAAKARRALISEESISE